MSCGAIRVNVVRVVTLVTAGLIGWAAAGCQTASPAVSVQLDSASFGVPSRVVLAGAINETLDFAFALTPSGEAVVEPRLKAGDFAGAMGSIDAAAIEIFRMQAVRLDHFPGWHVRAIPPAQRQRAPLDVLVPLDAPRGGLPRTLLPGQTCHFWADVHIPKGTPAGVYTTRLELLGKAGLGAAIDVELTVWPMVLPDESATAFVAELNHRMLFEHLDFGAASGPPPDDWRQHPRASDYDRQLTATMRLLQGHRLTPVLPELAPRVSLGAGGAVQVDWEHYDAIVEPLLSGRAFFNRVPLAVWSAPVSRLFAPGAAASVGAQAPSAEFMRQYVSNCTEHFQEKGWAPRAYLLAPIFAGESIEPAERVRRLAEAMDHGSPLRLATRRFPQDMAASGWVGFAKEELEGVDIWAPPGQFYDVEAMAEERRSGNAAWLGADRPPFSGSLAIHAPPACTRVLSWQAARLGAGAVQLGTINDWPSPAGGLSAEDCARRSPQVLLYPGRIFGVDEAVASVRLKHLRRSQQDAAYVRVLREHGLLDLVESVGTLLAGEAGSEAYRAHFADGASIRWADEPESYELARRVMAEAMLSRTGGASGRWDLSDSATGRRLLATETIDLRVDGSRVRLAGSPPAMQAEVETQLTLVNERADAASGLIRFDEPPPGWSNVALEEVNLAIAPGAARRVTLLTRADGLASGPDGLTLLPLEFKGDDGVTYRQTARVAFLTAMPPAGRLRIDGDLSDWPPGEQNVAANFRLISGGDTEVSRPGTRTAAFVLRDDENLYIAVTCETQGGEEPAAHRKGIRYDDLIPMEDEDLVEVLIDPTNAGTRSPSDLFHIAVKRSGTDLAEKGILTDPPCGLHEPWPVSLEIATRTASRRWMVEMRIPLAALDPDTHDNVVWGFNVTRWDAACQEFSTWSGAAGNAYDPLSLGNLFLP